MCMCMCTSYVFLYIKVWDGSPFSFCPVRLGLIKQREYLFLPLPLPLPLPRIQRLLLHYTATAPLWTCYLRKDTVLYGAPLRILHCTGLDWTGLDCCSFPYCGLNPVVKTQACIISTVPWIPWIPWILDLVDHPFCSFVSAQSRKTPPFTLPTHLLTARTGSKEETNPSTAQE